MRKFALLPLTVAITAGVANTSQAQPILEEVIVTAQKRAENVMDVPISISVFNAEMLEKLSARNLGDLGRFTAGVDMNFDAALQPTYTIRGIETADWTVGSDPAVAIYVDGVYAARGAGADAALADIARIEVLKGPQGTLFGRNATGGAIHLISQPPVFEEEARIKLTVGDYGRLDAEVMFNQPLGDTLAVRGNIVTRSRDGFLDNLGGTDLNEQDQQNYRLSFLWNASDNTEVLWRLDYSDMDQHAAAQYTLINSVFENANPGLKRDDFGDIHHDSPAKEEREMFATSLEINHQLGDMTLTSITGWREFDTELLEDLDGSNNPDYFFASSNPDSNDYFSQEFRLTGSGENLKWTVGGGYSRENVDHTTHAMFNMSTLETFGWAEILRNSKSSTSQAFLSSLIGLPQEEIDSLADLNNSEVGEVLPGYRQGQKDLGLDGTAMSAFLWSFLNDRGQLEDFGLSTDPAIGLFQILTDVGPRIAAFEPWNESVDSEGTYQSWAVYGDATWAVTERMNLTGGLRYTYDDKEFDIYTAYQNQVLGADLGLAFFNNGQPVLDVSQTEDWDAISGRLVMDYQFDETMVYASVATGFKSGGFNSLNFGPDIDTSYDEEEVINYEIGMKGMFLEDRLQLNLAGFFYEYDNLQELKLLGQPIPSYNLRNADAEGYGAELEFVWLAAEGLVFSGNYSWLKTEYTDFNIIAAAGESDKDDLTGEPRVDSPEHKLNFSAEYELSLGEFGALVSRLDYSWADERVESLEDPNRMVDSYDLINARISLLPDNGDWEFALWSTNLGDEEVITVFGSNGDAIGSLTGARIPPRMYGVDFIYNF